MSLGDVVDEFNEQKKNLPQGMSLQDYAKSRDQYEGSSLRQAAYNESWVQKVNDMVGKVSTGLSHIPLVASDESGSVFNANPDIAKSYVDSAAPGSAPGAGSMAGLAQQAGSTISPKMGEMAQKTAEGFPRLMAEVAPMMASGGVGAAALAPGMVDQAIQGVAGAQGAGRGPGQQFAQGALKAASFGAMPTAGAVGRDAAAQGLARTPIVNSTMQRIGEWMGEQGGMLAAGQTGDSAGQLASGKSPKDVLKDAVSPENVAQGIMGQLPWIPFGVKEAMSPARVDVNTPAGPVSMEVPTQTDAVRSQMADSAETASQMASPLAGKVGDFLKQAPDFTQPDSRQLFQGKTQDFIGSLSSEEYQQLHPLMARWPAPQDGAAQQAQNEFRDAAFNPQSPQASLIDVQAIGQARNSPEVQQAWKEYGDLYDKDPSNEAALTAKMDQVQSVETQQRTKVRNELLQSKILDIEDQAKTAGVDEGDFAEAKKYFQATGDWAPMQALVTQQSPEVQGYFKGADIQSKPFMEHNEDTGELNGGPKIWYHYTPYNFDQMGVTSDVGFHFGTLDQAEDRQMHMGNSPSGAGSGRILAGFANAQNPLRITDEGSWSARDTADTLGFAISQQAPDKMREVLPLLGQLHDLPEGPVPGASAAKQALFKQILNTAGFDSAVYKNLTEGANRKDSLILTDPNQFKSVSNKTPTADPRFDFSLTSPSKELDFSNPRSASPEAVVDAILTNRLVPTGIKGNDQAIQATQTLQQALVNPYKDFSTGGRNYAREKDLLQTGVLANKFGIENLDPKSSVTWKRMNDTEKKASLLMGRIYEDPVKALNLVEGRWAAQDLPPQVRQQQRIEQGAASVLATHSAPIGTPEQMGSLVRDANSYIGAVQDFVRQKGIEGALIQPEAGKGLRPLSELEMQKMMDQEMVKGGIFPEGEALSRVIESVKSRVMFAKQMAEDTLAKAGVSGPTRPELKDMSADSDFVGKLQGLPDWAQKVVGLYYGKAGENFRDKNNNLVSRLSGFRDEVGQALDSISPEDKARLAQEGPASKDFNPDSYAALGRRRRQGIEGSADEEGQGPDPMEAAKDAQTLREESQKLGNFQKQFETVPVQYKKGDSMMGSNLWDVLTHEHPAKRVEVLSEEAEEHAPEHLDTPGDAGESTEVPEDEKGPEAPTGEEGEQAKPYEDGLGGEIAKGPEKAILDKYFEQKGPLKDPVDALTAMSDRDLRMLYADVVGSKSLASKTSTIQKTGYMELGMDGTQASTNFIRDALGAEISGDHDARRAVIEKYWKGPYNQVYKKGEQDWNRIRKNLTSESGGAKAEAKLIALKAKLGGLEPKPGVDLNSIGAEFAGAKGGQQAFSYNLTRALTQEGLRRGLSRDWVDTMVPMMTKMMRPFAFIENAEFAMLANPQEAFNSAAKMGTALGLHIPTNTYIDGKPTQNPIIAADFKAIMDKFPYKDAAAYWMTTTLAHEGLHAFVSEVVRHPENPQPFHVQSQVRGYLDLIQKIHAMPMEDRLALAHMTIDTMLPDVRTREIGPDGVSRFSPEIQGLIKHAVQDPEEFAAFMYQHAVAGLAGEGVREQDGIKAASNVQDRMRWLDDDVREFARGQFRNLADHTAMMQKVLDDPDFRKSIGYKTDVATSVPGSDTQGKGASIVTPQTEGVGTNVRGIVHAAQQIAGPRFEVPPKPGETIVPKPSTPIANPTLLDHVARMDATLQKIEGQIDYMDQMMRGPAQLEQAGQEGGLKTINVADVVGDANFSRMTGVPPQSADQAKVAAGLSQRFLSGHQPGMDEKWRQNVFMRYGALMPQRMNYIANQGLDTARDASYSLNWQPIAHGLRDAVYGPITERQGRIGTVGLDKQKEWYKFMFQGPSGQVDEPSRKAFSDIVRAQQPVSDEDNRLQSDFSQKLIADKIKDLPAEKKGTVMGALQQYYDVTKGMLAQQIKTNRDTQASIIGYMAQLTNPKSGLNWRDAQQLGYLFLDHAQAMQVASDPQRGTPQAQQRFQALDLALKTTLASKGMDPGTAANGSNMAIPATEALGKQQALLQSGRNWAPEQRYGRYLVAWDGKDGRSTMGFDDPTQVKYFTRNLVQKEGVPESSILTHDTSTWSDQSRLIQGFSPLNAYQNELRRVFDTQLSKVEQIQSLADPSIGMRVAETIRQGFDPVATMAKSFASSQLKKNMMDRQYKPGRELIDYVDNMHNYVQNTTLAAARQSSRNRLLLQEQDMRQQGAGTLASDVERHWNETTTPEAPATRAIRQAVAGMSLALNLPNAMVELFQPLQTGLSVLTREGLGLKGSYQAFGNAAQTLTRYHLTGGPDEFKSLADAGTAKGNGASKEEMLASLYQRFHDQGRLGANNYMEGFDDDVKNVNVARPRFGELDFVDKAKFAGSAALNGAAWVGRTATWARAHATEFNQHITAYTALDAGYQKGLRGEPLYNYAANLIPIMNLIGGRYIRPFGATAVTENNSALRNTFGSFYVMQNFGIGFASMMAKDAHDGFNFWSKDLSPEAKSNARQALGQSLATTIGLGGVLAVPGVAAVMALVNNLFKVDPEAALREMLHNAGDKLGGLLGSDDQAGRIFTDLAMNGAVNHYTGVDFASRAGVSSLFGFNGDDGFSVSDLAGPTGSMIKNVHDAVGLLAQGQPMRAATKVAPTGVKNMMKMGHSLYNYGDMRILDNNDNMVANPKNVQALAYAMGFPLTDVSEKNREAQLMHRNQDNQLQQGEFQQEQYARGLLRGDNTPLLQYTQSRQFDTSFNPREYIQSVVQRAVDMQSPRDQLESGPLQGSRERAALGATFDTPRRSEMDRLQQREQLMANMGYPQGSQPAGMKDYIRASLIDQLVQTRGLSRQEAGQVVTRQLGF